MTDIKDLVKLIDENTNQIDELIQKKVQIWVNHVLFSNLWWIGVILSTVPWILWIWLRKKGSTDRLLYVGCFVSVVSIALDLFGDQMGLWNYRFNVFPIVPTYFPWDFTLMPLSVIALIQFKPKVNPYLKALVFALLTSFVAEAFFRWILIYNPKEWEFIYSLPIQFCIYIAAHYLAKRNNFEKVV